jgi:hypothetical protein
MTLGSTASPSSRVEQSTSAGAVARPPAAGSCPPIRAVSFGALISALVSAYTCGTHPHLVPLRGFLDHKGMRQCVKQHRVWTCPTTN